MSLFGESPPDKASFNPNTNSNSNSNSKLLFGEEAKTATNTASDSLFAEDSSNASPWSMPTPKKNARQNMIKNLLPATEVPESYVDAYDTVIHAGETTGAGVSLAAVRNILQSSSLSAADREKILKLVLPGSQEPANGLGRSEFNVVVALIGLSLEGDDVSLDGVDERRRRLPQPSLPHVDKLRTRARPKTPAAEPNPPSPEPARPNKSYRQDTLGADPTSDPWATSAIKNIPPSTASHTMRPATIDDEFLAAATNGIPRTTSTFTTSGDQNTNPSESPTGARGAGGDGGSGWGSYNGSNPGAGAESFGEQTVFGGGLGGGFGDSGDGQSNRPNHNPQPSAAPGGSIAIPPGTGELVTITILPEKEGSFLFQHHNYEVKTIRRGSSVVRRYSDFVWLLDCLQKRYPFRRLPLLPPKRVSVNGNHLSADGLAFLEKRRRGLVRFSNSLVQHPVLSQETLVVMFFTVPTELSVWRKQATISVQEEFVGKALPPTLEDSLPATLPELFDQVRTGVRRSAEIYIGLCVLLERLAKRNEAMAADTFKFSQALETLVESSNDTYSVDTNDVPLLNEGIRSTAKHMLSSQTLLEDEARAWDANTLEDFKKIRDGMVSMRDMFDRRDKFAKDNIPQLERRIQNSENKLRALRTKPEVKPGEMEKVEGSILADKESIVQQHARGVFIKECVRDEIVTFQRSIYAISQLHQDWAQERVKYAELQASNWRTLVEDIESMPVGDA